LARNCPSCGNSEAPGSNFCSKCGASFHLTGAVHASPKLVPGLSPRATFAERSHLTVMFCDLVGSTALSVQLDVEDFHELIATYQKRVAEIVTRFGGFVARRVGDGVLVYFGYPNAEEDDPEQAVRASLALVDGVGARNRFRCASALPRASWSSAISSDRGASTTRRFWARAQISPRDFKPWPDPTRS
jgi:hypothetical protein